MIKNRTQNFREDNYYFIKIISKPNYRNDINIKYIDDRNTIRGGRLKCKEELATKIQYDSIVGKCFVAKIKNYFIKELIKEIV